MKSLLLTPFVLHTRPVASRALSDLDTVLPTQNKTKRPAHPLGLADKMASSSSLAMLLRDLDTGVVGDGVVAHSPLAEPNAGIQTARDLNVARYCEILGCIEDLILDHILHDHSGLPGLSRLAHLVPSIGKFFTPLPLKFAFLKMDPSKSIAARRFVPPSFNDIRHLLNAAQVSAIAKTVKLITFDGDMTLYADGKDFSRDSHLVELILKLLESEINVAIVTAAGYPADASRYEQRLSGLLDGFRASALPHSSLAKFYVLGGECNYLFRYNPASGRLVYIPPEDYEAKVGLKWKPGQDKLSKFLDIAERNLKECMEDMGLQKSVCVLRKQLAVGVIPNPGVELSREQLDEFALSTQRRLRNYQFFLNSESGFDGIPIPFCAFNGGSDVWVDIGNKLIGVQLLQKYLGTLGHETLHVGDQFLSTGNDIATRTACCTVWITSPKETGHVLQDFFSVMAEGDECAAV